MTRSEIYFASFAPSTTPSVHKSATSPFDGIPEVERFCFALRCRYSRSKRRRLLATQTASVRTKAYTLGGRKAIGSIALIYPVIVNAVIDRPAADENMRSAAPASDSPFLLPASRRKWRRTVQSGGLSRGVLVLSREPDDKRCGRRPTAVAELGIGALPGLRQLRPFAESPLLSSPTAFPGIMFCTSYFAPVKPDSNLLLGALFFKTQYYFRSASIIHSFADFRRPIGPTTRRKAELIIRLASNKESCTFLLFVSTKKWVMRS